MKNGMGYWRLMADLNPAIKTEIFKTLFDECLKTVAVEQYSLATEQGNHYFFIPALARHRGVSHFYLEGYNGKNTQIDFDLATSLGKAVVDCYVDIFSQALKEESPLPNAEDYRQQIEYHTLYLFQVLTLDRGTTSGLLIHSQNDLGIMGSLPAKIDRALLTSWKEKLVEPQKQLLADIVNVLPNTSPCCINDTTKLALANVVRQHYQSNPDALSQQAQSKVIADTVNNHR